MKQRVLGRSWRGRIFLLCWLAVFGIWGTQVGFQITSDVLYLAERHTGELEKRTINNEALPWHLTLVNAQQEVPADFALDLVEAGNGELVDARIYEPLMAMLEAAEKAGLGPVLASGYRDQAEQQRLFQEKTASFRAQGYDQAEAEKLAEQWVARPGFSEHHLGLAVDINGSSYDIYPWLEENCARYGFIFRYAKDKTAYTGVAEEVWHYRYVGEAAAREIMAQGICLEEYLARY